MEKTWGKAYLLHTAARIQNCYYSVNAFFSYCLPRAPLRVPTIPVCVVALVILWLQGKTQVSLGWRGEAQFARESAGVWLELQLYVLFESWFLTGLQCNTTGLGQWKPLIEYDTFYYFSCIRSRYD